METVPTVLLPGAIGTAPPEQKIVEQPGPAQVTQAPVLEYAQVPAAAQVRILIVARILTAGQVQRAKADLKGTHRVPFVYLLKILFLV
jgi:hypothetical protein